jgi:phage terminase small subunit
MREHLLQWQWSDYAAKHRNQNNLLLHIFAVPLFQLGTLALLYAVIKLSLVLVIVSAGAMLISLVLQARGHKLESEMPAPFEGKGDFPSRFLAEQWITFPRFVLSGGWLRNVTRPRP